MKLITLENSMVGESAVVNDKETVDAEIFKNVAIPCKMKTHAQHKLRTHNGSYAHAMEVTQALVYMYSYTAYIISISYSGIYSLYQNISA